MRLALPTEHMRWQISHLPLPQLVSRVHQDTHQSPSLAKHLTLLSIGLQEKSHISLLRAPGSLFVLFERVGLEPLFLVLAMCSTRKGVTRALERIICGTLLLCMKPMNIVNPVFIQICFDCALKFKDCENSAFLLLMMEVFNYLHRARRRTWQLEIQNLTWRFSTLPPPLPLHEEEAVSMMQTKMGSTFYLQTNSGKTYVAKPITHIMDLTVSCLVKQLSSVTKRLPTLDTEEDKKTLLHQRPPGP